MSNGDNWCRHYNGTVNQTCKAGVDYNTVRDTSTKPYDYPCTRVSARDLCPHFEAKTAEEIEARRRAIAEVIAKLEAVATGESDECLHCGAKVTAMQQVGRCVYAEPCGHRQYQGRVPERWL